MAQSWPTPTGPPPFVPYSRVPHHLTCTRRCRPAASAARPHDVGPDRLLLPPRAAATGPHPTYFSFFPTPESAPPLSFFFSSASARSCWAPPHPPPPLHTGPAAQEHRQPFILCHLQWPTSLAPEQAESAQIIIAAAAFSPSMVIAFHRVIFLRFERATDPPSLPATCRSCLHQPLATGGLSPLSSAAVSAPFSPPSSTHHHGELASISPCPVPYP
jgi:hypothetical protein